jgi:hypothetical protein
MEFNGKKITDNLLVDYENAISVLFAIINNNENLTDDQIVEEGIAFAEKTIEQFVTELKSKKQIDPKIEKLMTLADHLVENDLLLESVSIETEAVN